MFLGEAVWKTVELFRAEECLSFSIKIKPFSFNQIDRYIEY